MSLWRPVYWGSEGSFWCWVCGCSLLCSSPLATVWNLADKESVSLTHRAATMLGLRRAIKMVATRFLPGVAARQGRQVLEEELLEDERAGICCARHICLAVDHAGCCVQMSWKLNVIGMFWCISTDCLCDSVRSALPAPALTFTSLQHILLHFFFYTGVSEVYSFLTFIVTW